MIIVAILHGSSSSRSVAKKKYISHTSSFSEPPITYQAFKSFMDVVKLCTAIEIKFVRSTTKANMNTGKKGT